MGAGCAAYSVRVEEDGADGRGDGKATAPLFFLCIIPILCSPPFH